MIRIFPKSSDSSFSYCCFGFLFIIIINKKRKEKVLEWKNIRLTKILADAQYFAGANDGYFTAGVVIEASATEDVWIILSIWSGCCLCRCLFFGRRWVRVSVLPLRRIEEAAVAREREPLERTRLLPDSPRLLRPKWWVRDFAQLPWPIAPQIRLGVWSRKALRSKSSPTHVHIQLSPLP